MPAETITAFEQFLAWGPIGFAGLMLVLVIFAMVTSKLTRLKAMMLSFFMIIGAGCFGAALYFDSIENTGEHRLVLSVLPNDIDESGFPPPAIKVNGQAVDRADDMIITGTTLLQVDVNRAIRALQEADRQVEEAATQVATISQDLEATSATARTLEREVNRKDAQLAEASQTIQQQQVAISEAQETGVALTARIQGLQAQISRLDSDTFAPVERDLRNIQREMLQFNQLLVVPGGE